MNQTELRKQLAEARRALRYSQSLCRALAGNPIYGIYRCTAEGQLIDVNHALATMLGYSSREELLAANQESRMIPAFRSGSCFAAPFSQTNGTEPIEIEWKHKSGAILKVRLSGHDIENDQGEVDGQEVIAVDVTKQRVLESQLRHQASSDSLTGLANRRRLFEVLHSEVGRSGRTTREFSLLLLDLDGLKRINDQFGHLGGDRALCRLGAILSASCRSVDTAARHGGDEFALVLPETGRVAATLAARRIRELLQTEAEEPALSVSVGIATYPLDADSVGTLLSAADKSLYQMKSAESVIHEPLSVCLSPTSNPAKQEVLEVRREEARPAHA